MLGSLALWHVYDMTYMYTYIYIYIVCILVYTHMTAREREREISKLVYGNPFSGPCIYHGAWGSAEPRGYHVVPVWVRLNSCLGVGMRNPKTQLRCSDWDAYSFGEPPAVWAHFSAALAFGIMAVG